MQSSEVHKGKEDDDLVEQEDIIKEYAKEEGCWFEGEALEDLFFSSEKFASESESDVYIAKDRCHVIKVVNPYASSNCIETYLDNKVSLYNYLFPEAPYKLLGFSEKEEEIRILLSQPFVQGTLVGEILDDVPNFKVKEAEENFKKDIAKDLGKRIGELNEKTKGAGNLYANSSYIIEDIHSANVILTPKNNYIYIDVNPSLNTPEEFNFGNREYGKGNIINIEK